MLQQSSSRLCGGWLTILLGLIREWSTTLSLMLTLASAAVITSLLVAKTSTCSPLLTVRLILLTSGLSLSILRITLLQSLLRWRISNWTWNVFGAFVDIEVLVNRRRYWLNLRSQLLLDLIKVEAIIPVDQVDRQTKMTKPA